MAHKHKAKTNPPAAKMSKLAGPLTNQSGNGRNKSGVANSMAPLPITIDGHESVCAAMPDMP
jgi:hypothetical protein